MADGPSHAKDEDEDEAVDGRNAQECPSPKMARLFSLLYIAKNYFRSLNSGLIWNFSIQICQSYDT